MAICSFPISLVGLLSSLCTHRAEHPGILYLQFSLTLLRECEWWLISSGSWSASSKLRLLFLQICVGRHLLYSRAPECERTIWPWELTAHNSPCFLWTFDFMSVSKILCQWILTWSYVNEIQNKAKYGSGCIIWRAQCDTEAISHLLHYEMRLLIELLSDCFWLLESVFYTSEAGLRQLYCYRLKQEVTVERDFFHSSNFCHLPQTFKNRWEHTKVEES